MGMQDLPTFRKILNLYGARANWSAEAIMKRCNAFWIYQANAGKPGPHAILASGKHSDGYINTNAVLMYPNLCQSLAKSLIKQTEKYGITRADAVVSSSYAAITLGQEFARQMDALFFFTEKDGENQKWSGRFEIPAGVKSVLQVEELITTLSTAQKVRQAFLDANPDIGFVKDVNGKTVVATIVHRPEKLPCVYPDCQIIPLMELAIRTWKPEECPLCKAGSEPLKPIPYWDKFVPAIK